MHRAEFVVASFSSISLACRRLLPVEEANESTRAIAFSDVNWGKMVACVVVVYLVACWHDRWSADEAVSAKHVKQWLRSHLRGVYWNYWSATRCWLCWARLSWITASRHHFEKGLWVLHKLVSWATERVLSLFKQIWTDGARSASRLLFGFFTPQQNCLYVARCNRKPCFVYNIARMPLQLRAECQLHPYTLSLHGIANVVVAIHHQQSAQ